LLCAGAACGGGGPARHTDGSVSDLPDLGSVVTGSALLAGDLDLFGLTTDDVAAVLDQNQGALAVPLSGAAPQLIDPAANVVEAVGAVIFSFHNYDVIDAFGDTTIWTAAKGAVPFVGGATLAAAVSDDGTRILATGGTSSDATASNLVLGGIDGTPPRTLMPIALGGSCRPLLTFTGGMFVASHCAPGATTVAISTIDPTSGVVTDLLASAKNVIRVVPGGAGLVALTDAAGSAYLFPVAGGTSTFIGDGVAGWIVSPDGSAVFLRESANVVRVPVSGGAATTILSRSVTNLAGASPDGQQLLFQTVEGLAGGFGDLWLTPATSAGSGTRLSTDINTATFGSPFTADGTMALYFTGADLYGVGTFTAAAVAGGAPVVLGEGGWSVKGYAGARIIYMDRYEPVAKRPGRGALRTADLAAADPPAIVATHAGGAYYLTQANDRVVFSFNDGTAQSGLYLAPLP
jgi:hypothetical protein